MFYHGDQKWILHCQIGGDLLKKLYKIDLDLEFQGQKFFYCILFYSLFFYHRSIHITENIYYIHIILHFTFIISVMYNMYTYV